LPPPSPPRCHWLRFPPACFWHRKASLQPIAYNSTNIRYHQ
jgi:hypothetical protein